MNFKSYCEKEGKHYLLEEWDNEKNTSFTPETINHSSSLPVWWKCKNGHSWQTQLKSRSTSLTGCPRCNEKRLAEKRDNQIKNFRKEESLC